MAVKENDEETINFEEYSNIETHATFYQMNLSRPLLKVLYINILCYIDFKLDIILIYISIIKY